MTIGESGMRVARGAHMRTLVMVIAALALVQVFAGVAGSVRELQYYTRIIYLAEINIILTVSLALINGFTGQFSLGHAGFMALGAYASVVITTVLPRLLGGSPASVASVQGHLLFVCAVVAAGVVAGLCGFVIGFPSLRLRGDYLAIVTLAASEVIRALLRYTDFLGGPRGVPAIPRFTNATYLGLALAGSLWVMRNYMHSHHGRACIAVRDNEIAAATMGINPTAQKVSAFVIGAFFAGIAGALFAHTSQYINPDNFGILKSLDLLIFLYVGGSTTLAGGIVGASLFTVVPELLRMAHLESWRMVVYPLVLIMVMRFRQSGIMGSREFGFLIPWKYKEMQLLRGKLAVRSSKSEVQSQK